MKKNYLIFLQITLILFFISSNKSIGQESHSFSCFTSTNINSQLLQREIKTNDPPANCNTINTPSGCYIIPYIVHVLHVPGEQVGEGSNISSLQIQSQIAYTNRYFSGNNYLNQNGLGIQLRPAIYDESNNPLAEPGISRNEIPNINGTLPNDGYIYSFTFNDTIKPMYIWNPEKYLNIWLFNGKIDGATDSSGDFIPDPGRTRYPGNPCLPAIDLAPNAISPNYGISTLTDDGIYLINKYFTSTEFCGPEPLNVPPAPFDAAFGQEEIFMHEFGHWLGLRHIDGSGGCSLSYIDTPLGEC